MRYSKHAKRRMVERHITFAEVDETVANPFVTRLGHSRRVHYYKSIRRFNLRVTIVTDVRGVKHVITVWKERLP